MSTALILSSVLITMALIFYSIGVWSERISRYLKSWHVIAFWIGFMFDVSGTWAMSRLSERSFDILDPHTLTGQIALWLMLVHALWASYVVWKQKESERESFHRYSIFVWCIWMIPYIGCMYLGMS